MFEVVEPTKPAPVKGAKGKGTGDGSWWDFDHKKMKFPLLAIVFGITAYYQLIYKKKERAADNSDNDIVNKLETSIGRRLDPDISN